MLIMDDINMVDNLGRTLLHDVAVRGDEVMLDVLMYLNIDLDAKDSRGCTPMHLAAQYGNVAVVDKLIQEGANINLRSDAGWTSLTYACDGCHEDVVVLLLSRGIEIDAVSLEIAVASAQNSREIGGVILNYLKYECNIRITKAFYSRDLDKLREVISLLKPLYRLQENNILSIGNITRTTWILEEAYRVNDVAVLKILLENDINLDLKECDGNTFLIVCEYGSLYNVETLLMKDIMIDAVNDKGETCLFIAARNNNTSLMKLLLACDVWDIINVPNKCGVVPLHIACAYGNEEIISRLIKKGANIYYKTNLKIFLNSVIRGLICIDELGMERMGNLDYVYVDSVGVACFLGYINVVNILICEGYNINNSMYFGNTALHIACMRSNILLMKYLINRGADVNVSNEFGNTPLHIACINKNSKAVLELVNKGANVMAFNRYGKTPLYIAYERNNVCVIRIISSMYDMSHVVNMVYMNGITLLHLACRGLNVSGVAFLLKAGAKADAVDFYGNSSLHYMYDSNIKHDRKERFRKILKMLKANGLDVDMKNMHGYSGLDMACMGKKVDDVCVLIENGAQIDMRTMEIAKSVKEGEAIVNILNEKKSRVNVERVDVKKDTSDISVSANKSPALTSLC